MLLVGAVVFALYGLCFGLLFRSETAVSAAGGSVVVLGFLGNIFFPLSGRCWTSHASRRSTATSASPATRVTEGWMVTADGALIQEALVDSGR